MLLCDWLEKNYIIRPMLMFPNVHANLDLTYRESVSEETKSRIRDALADLGLDVEIGQRFTVGTVRIDVSEEEGTLCCEVDGKRKYRFPRTEAIQAFAWTAYALAAQNSWLPDEDSEIVFIGYHIASQQIAASVMSEIQNKLGSSPNVRERIESIAKAHSRRFLEEAPAFSRQVLTEQGMEYVESITGVFKRAETVGLEELAEKLYGMADFKETIEAYCAWMLNGSERFRKELKKAMEECVEYLYSQSSYCMRDSIESAKAEILKEYSYKDEIIAAEHTLQMTTTVKNLKPDGVGQIFDATDRAYKKASDSRIFTAWLTEFCSALANRMEAETRTAIQNLKQTAAQVRNFCAINANNYGLTVHWNNEGEIDLDRLRIQNAEWSVSTINNAQQETWLPSGYVNRIWFAGEAVSEEANNGGASAKVEAIKGLDEKLLCALFAKPCRENGAQA